MSREEAPLRPDVLLERPVTFFGGKGGVGKTTIAAAAAIRSADAGHRTLLVSTDPAHSAGDALDVELGSEPRRVAPRLWALEIDPDVEAERYIEGVKQRVREIASPRLLGEVEREIDIARVSPGAGEAALFEKLAELALDGGERFDRIVFDTAPTGHTLRLLSLPELMTVWIDGLVRRRRKANVLARMWRNVAGAAASDRSPAPDPVLDALERRRDRFRAARERFTDRSTTAFHFVLLPDRLPILETARAVETLARHRIPIGAILVNRVRGTRTSAAADPRDAREAGYLHTIRSTFADYPMLTVPESGEEVHGPDSLRALLAKLARLGPDPR